ncbi:WD40 repeat domain-containing protein [Streptosporangium canum]|uniref:WD40 repeat domain-containing protein n=1 Tax=Streptosporangium canum TaxID=324952 RepID=UPI0034233EE7
MLDTASGRVLRTFSSRIGGGPYTPDGRLASTRGRFIDLTTGKPLDAAFDVVRGASAVAVSDQGRLAFSAGPAGRIAMWTLRGPAQITPVLRGTTGEIVELAFSPKGDLLAGVTTDGILQIWDVNAMRRLGGAFNLHRHEDARWLQGRPGDRVSALHTLRRTTRASMSQVDWMLPAFLSWTKN